MGGLFPSKPRRYAWLGILVPFLAIGGFMIGEQLGRDWRKNQNRNGIRTTASGGVIYPERGSVGPRGANSELELKWTLSIVTALGVVVVLVVGAGVVRKLSEAAAPAPAPAQADSRAMAESDEWFRRRLRELEAEQQANRPPPAPPSPAPPSAPAA